MISQIRFNGLVKRERDRLRWHMFRNSLLQRVPGAFRSSEVRSEKLGGINRSWNSMLWMVLAFCNAVLTLTSKRSKHKLILEGCISCFELPSSFMPSCSSSFSVIVHFGFILSPSIFCPFFRRPKFCCVPRSVCLECSSTFCFSGLSYCSSMAAVLTFRSNNFSFPASHCAFPFVSLEYLCKFQYHFHKRTFCVPFHYFYGEILLFLVIPRLTAYAFLCFTVGPPHRPLFVFLFLTSGTPFLIR